MKNDLILLKIFILSHLINEIKKQKNSFMDIVKNWRTSLIGALLACLYLLQSAYHDNQMILANIDWFDYAISALIIIATAFTKDSVLTGVKASVFALAFMCAIDAHAQSNGVVYSNVWLPAAGAEGAIQVNHNGSISGADTINNYGDTTEAPMLLARPEVAVIGLGNTHINTFTGVIIAKDSAGHDVSIVSDTFGIQVSGIHNNLTIGTQSLKYLTVNDTTGTAFKKGYNQTAGAFTNNTIFYGQTNTTAGTDTIYLDSLFTSGWRAIISAPNEDSVTIVQHTLYSDHSNYIAFVVKTFNGSAYVNATEGTKVDFLIIGK